MEMDDVLLFFQEVDELNITELAKVPLQPFLAEGFEVLNVSDVHVPRRTGVDGKCEIRGSGPKFLPQPTFSLRLLRIKPWNEVTW